MSDAARRTLDDSASLPPLDRARVASALIASVRDELIEVALEPEELSFLRRGLNEWGGPARCTEEMAMAMGFLGTEQFSEEVYARLLPALDARQPLSRVDWLRVLLATEIVFVSDVLGSGVEWHITTGLSDIDTLALLRGVQRKLGREVRFLVGAGFGTRRDAIGRELVVPLAWSGYDSGMTNAARKLLDDAMALPSEDRARLAAALLASLDDRADPDATSAWAAEVERRAERVLTGEAEGAPWDEVRARLLDRLAQR